MSSKYGASSVLFYNDNGKISLRNQSGRSMVCKRGVYEVPVGENKGKVSIVMRVLHAKHSLSRRVDNIMSEGIKKGFVGALLGVSGVALGAALGIPTLMTGGLVAGVGLPVLGAVSASVMHPKKADKIRVGKKTVIKLENTEKGQEIVIRRNPDNAKEVFVEYSYQGEKVGTQRSFVRQFNQDKMDQLIHIAAEENWQVEDKGGYKQVHLPETTRVEQDNTVDDCVVQEVLERQKVRAELAQNAHGNTGECTPGKFSSGVQALKDWRERRKKRAEEKERTKATKSYNSLFKNKGR